MQSTLTLEQLHQRFFLEESPYWWAYDAARRNATISKFRDNDPVLTDEEKLMYSWLQLEELIQTFGAGHMKVVLKKNASDNANKSPTYYVKWGADAGAKLGSTAVQNQNPEVRYMERIFQMQEANHRQQIELLTDLMKERHTRENLEDQIEGMANAGPGISESLLHGGLDILKTMLKPTAALGTLEAGGSVPPLPEMEGGEIPHQASTDGARPFSLDQAIADISIIRNALPGRHVNDVLRALAVFASNSPGQADQYLGMLINSMGHEG